MATPIKTANGSWRIQVEIKGQRDGGTFPTKREANEWAAKRTTELRAMTTGKAGTVKTLGDVLEEYAVKVSTTKKGCVKEQIRIKSFLRQARFPHKVKLSELTTKHLVDWRDARLSKVSRGSVLREITLIGHAIEIARVEWQWLETNPMRDVRKPQEPDHRTRVITNLEIRKMLRVLGWDKSEIRTVHQAIAAAFLLALQTGCRAGEICNLRWSDLKKDTFIVDGKSGMREVPAVPTTLKVIERMRGFDQEFVFGLTAQSLDAMFRKYRKRAGLSGFTFHDSRHTAATRLAQSLHVLYLCKMFGWSNTKQALTYFNPTGSDITKRLIAAPRQ